MRQTLFAATLTMCIAALPLVSVHAANTASQTEIPGHSLQAQSLTLKSVQTETSGALSKTCFRFDQTLTPRQDLPLRSYIAVEPQRDFSAYIDDKSLCIKGLPFSQTTHVTLRQGLSGNENHSLNADISKDIAIGPRPKSISFGQGGYVLPRQGDPMLPITTVNYDRLDLKFFRVDERNFVSLLQEDSLQTALQHWQRYQLAEHKGAEIWSGQVDISAQQDADTVTRIPLAQMVAEFKPGIYALVAAPPGTMDDYDKHPAQWVIVTDLGLSMYRGANGFSAQVRSLKTADPIDDVKFRLIAANNMVLAEGTSDDDGWFDLPGTILNGKGGKRPLYLTAQDEDGDFSFISLRDPALDLSEHGVAGVNPPGPLQAYVYSERGVYRPGEAIRLGYLLRNDAANAQNAIPLTLHLIQPDGKLAQKITHTPDTLGGGRVDIPIPAAAATGTWTVSIFSDPEQASIGDYPFEVSEFVPNRLEVKTTTAASALQSDAPSKFDVQADYLFGAPGANLRVQGRATLRVDRTPFADLKGFVFGIAEDVQNRRSAVLNGKSDAKGYVELVLPPFENVDYSSPLRLDVDVDVLDTDGRPNHAKLSVPYHHRDALVGLKPAFSGAYGDTASFDAIAVDANGKPLPNHSLTIEWIHEDRDYNWYMRGDRWVSSYKTYDQVIASDRVTTDANGRITLSRKFDDWGYYRAAVTSAQYGSAADFSFRVGWAENSRAPDTPDALDLQLDSTDIKSGNRIKGHVKAPFAGQAVLTIAHKSVLWREEISLPKAGRSFSIPVNRDWGSGAYLLVTAYRPGEQKDQRGPGRAVGAQWLSFDQHPRILSATLDVPDTVRPNTHLQLPIQVSGAVVGKEAIKVNVFAVDEGILQLTGFATPKPSKALLAQQRLQLDYHDLYGRIIPPKDGSLGTLRSGGDTAGGNRNMGGLTTRSFKTVALASQTVDVDKTGQATVNFDIPDYTGKLRVFAVAYSKTATGSGTAALPVKSPINAELLPSRFLAPGDQSQFAFRFQNLDGPAGPYTITLETSDQLEIADPVWTTDSQPGDSTNHRFDVTALAEGKAKITVRIDGPDGYHRSRDYDLQIRHGRPWTHTYVAMDLEAGASATIPADVFAPYSPTTGRLSLTASNLPDLDVQRIITALDRYPYGCLEQVTSQSFPLLYFRNVASAWDGLNFKAETLDSRIGKGISAVLAKQRPDGSFGLWSSRSPTEPWLTAYAMDFLTEARAHGYAVLQERFDSGLDWMKASVRNGNWSADARAYMLMVLTRNNAFSTSQFKYQHKAIGKSSLRALSRAQLSAASLYQGLTPDGLTAKRIFALAGRDEDSYQTYGSPLRDAAAILTLPKEVFASPEDRHAVLHAVSAASHRQSYFSTQENGWLLRAAATVTATAGKGVALTLNGKAVSSRHAYRMTVPDMAYAGPLTISNSGDGKLFAGYTVSGIPDKPLPPSSNSFSIQRTYLTPDGKPVDLASVRSGDRFWVIIKGVLPLKSEHRALIVDMLPAGLEMDGRPTEQDLNVVEPDKYRLSATSFRAERDDRFVAAVNMYEYNRSFTLAYSVRAVTPGLYLHPAPFVEDMYRPSLHARGKEGMLTVIPAE
jgi:uncharacterized protein YfaS (alpha-2-macroglobulin family)